MPRDFPGAGGAPVDSSVSGILGNHALVAGVVACAAAQVGEGWAADALACSARQSAPTKNALLCAEMHLTAALPPASSSSHPLKKRLPRSSRTTRRRAIGTGPKR